MSNDAQLRGHRWISANKCIAFSNCLHACKRCSHNSIAASHRSCVHACSKISLIMPHMNVNLPISYIDSFLLAKFCNW